jgi:hypothetical protein
VEQNPYWGKCGHSLRHGYNENNELDSLLGFTHGSTHVKGQDGQNSPSSRESDSPSYYSYYSYYSPLRLTGRTVRTVNRQDSPLPLQYPSQA